MPTPHTAITRAIERLRAVWLLGAGLLLRARDRVLRSRSARGRRPVETVQGGPGRVRRIVPRCVPRSRALERVSCEHAKRVQRVRCSWFD